MGKIRKKEIFENIRNICIKVYYDNEKKELDKQFELTPNSKNYDLWDSMFQEYIRNINVTTMSETLTTDFIKNAKINSLYTNIEQININNEILKVKNLNVCCDKSRFLNILFPSFDMYFLPKLCERIDIKRRNIIIQEYLNNVVDNIVVFPSKHISEGMFYPDFDGEYKNVFSFFNYKSSKTDEEFLKIDDLITEIIEDFYIENKNFIDSYKYDNKKITISFSNNKNIILYDKLYINQIESLIDRIKDDLINKNIDNIMQKRKVYKNGTNNNGKDGKSM